MSVDCYCHPNHYECPVMYDGEPNYPVPSCLGQVEWIIDGSWIGLWINPIYDATLLYYYLTWREQ